MSANDSGLTVSGEFHFERRGRGGRKGMAAGAVPITPAGRVPRVARLMALAIKFEGLVREGAVADYADLARLGRVTRARVTQIMNLTLLAPDIQEELLHLPPVERGRDQVILRNLQPIAMTLDWRKQRKLWAVLSGTPARKS